jgi:histidinol phosphatase-like enzyme (inositol monophosphatase family)
MDSSFSKELEFGRAIARRAGETALRYWRKGVQADIKPDASPVTAADRECERLIAAAIEEAFPDDGVFGEEGSNRAGVSGRRWIIDPIDGTRDFLRGTPIWANFIGLEDAGEVVAGFVNLPAIGELYSAARGAGAWANGERIHASSVTEISQAFLLVEALNDVGRYAWAPRLLDFVKPFWAVRCLGGCYDSMLVARGVADLWIETGGKAWDFAPLKIIAEEAGARFFDFRGEPTIYGRSGVICAPGLEKTVREFLGCGGSATMGS